MARTQDYGLGEFTFPRGWFMVADAEELKAEPIGVRFFARDFALYRGKSGKLSSCSMPTARTWARTWTKNTSSYIVRDGDHVQGDSGSAAPTMAGAFSPTASATTSPMPGRSRRRRP